MNFDKDLYEYYLKRENRKNLAQAMCPNRPEFSSLLLSDILECKRNKDDQLLELQLIILSIFCQNIDFSMFTDVFNSLIIEDWHTQHENIVYFMEFFIADNSSVPYLHQAIVSDFEYISWNEFKTFERKCIWTLGKIQTDDAKEELLNLAGTQSEPISRYAKKQLMTSYGIDCEL